MQTSLAFVVVRKNQLCFEAHGCGATGQECANQFTGAQESFQGTCGKDMRDITTTDTLTAAVIERNDINCKAPQLFKFLRHSAIQPRC